jgi:DNA-binding MarR family transcriptional regulator
MPFFDESNFYPDTSPGYLVRVLHQMSVAAIEGAFVDEGITATQWMALISIHFGRNDTCAALARALEHDKGAMTRMVDQMEASGWVSRQRDPDDRRVVRLALTDEGHATAMAARRKAIACWNHVLADWSDAEIEGLLATLGKLRRTMEERAPCAA